MIEITTTTIMSHRGYSLVGRPVLSITMASPDILTRGNAVACPYFMPVAKIENGSWPHPARLPLGCGWNGHCTAPGHEGQAPSQDILEVFCNLGYASSCSWAPLQRVWDAVRFAVNAPVGQVQKNKSAIPNDAPARILRLTYICERDHRPVEAGELEFDVSQAAWLKPHSDSRIQKMAECFLESYLKRKA